MVVAWAWCAQAAASIPLASMRQIHALTAECRGFGFNLNKMNLVDT
jgi:hypothetical protein